MRRSASEVVPNPSSRVRRFAERPDEESGRREQHQADRDLSDDQRSRQPGAACGHVRRLQRRLHVDARRDPGWREPEDQRRRHPCEDRESHDPEIGRDVDRQRPRVTGRHGHQHAAPPHRDEQAGRGSGDGQHQALDQELSQQPAATCARRDPDRDLPAPRRRPREQQVRHVGTDDEQDQRHGGRQDLERRTESRAQGRRSAAAIRHLHARRVVVVLLAKTRDESVQPGTGIAVAHSGRQPAEDPEPRDALAVENRRAAEEGRLRGQQCPYVG